MGSVLGRVLMMGVFSRPCNLRWPLDRECGVWRRVARARQQSFGTGLGQDQRWSGRGLGRGIGGYGCIDVWIGWQRGLNTGGKAGWMTREAEERRREDKYREKRRSSVGLGNRVQMGTSGRGLSRWSTRRYRTSLCMTRSGSR